MPKIYDERFFDCCPVPHGAESPHFATPEDLAIAESGRIHDSWVYAETQIP